MDGCSYSDGAVTVGVCYFLVAEQESNQRSRHRGGTEFVAPALKAVPPLCTPPARTYDGAA